MKTLVIVAHPDLTRSRINTAWTNAAVTDGRATVRILTDVTSPQGFNITAEQRALEEHDRIVLQFPFHWYSSPPLLKTWLDDVLEHGWAYGPGGTALQGKELALAISTWSAAADYTTTGRYGRTMTELTSPYEVTALRTDMHYRPGFFLNGVGHVTDQELTQNATEYVRWLNEK